MKFWKLSTAILCLSGCLTFGANAQDHNAAKLDGKVVLSEGKESASKILMSVESLDKAWEQRETKEAQEQIYSFVKEQLLVPKDYEIAWRVARLVYFCGNFGLGENLSDSEHVKMFLYGYKAGELAKKLNTNRPEGYYWFAVDLGSYGLAKGIFSALSNATAGRDALLEVAHIDPNYHWAGAYRILGRYYQEVPSFISFGDKKKAEDFFQKAIKLAPNYVLNKIYLGILYSELGRKEEASKIFKDAESMPDIDGKNESIKFRAKLKESMKKING
jgi:tetratricopeptide (TPR) repeat protein